MQQFFRNEVVIDVAGFQGHVVAHDVGVIGNQILNLESLMLEILLGVLHRIQMLIRNGIRKHSLELYRCVAVVAG